ncbi:MAG: hypothetical protein MUP27_08780 [Desulfobacterales bacterium]|nr:hypothetical protein [Desulfobacterales bacterium]
MEEWKPENWNNGMLEQWNKGENLDQRKIDAKIFAILPVFQYFIITEWF